MFSPGLFNVERNFLRQAIEYSGFWMQPDGQRIYPLKIVLKSINAVPAFELVLRRQFPHYITPCQGQLYVSYGLVQLLHIRQ